MKLCKLEWLVVMEARNTGKKRFCILMLAVLAATLIGVSAFFLSCMVHVPSAYAQTSLSSNYEERTQEGDLSEPMRITRKVTTLKAGYAFKFQVNKPAVEGQKVVWKVSNRNIATISANGKLKAKMAGTIRVTAKCAGQSSTVKLKIKPKKIVALDPGHSSRIPSGSEPIGPGSSTYKAKDNSGTAGRYTRVPEYKVTLNVAKKMKRVLEGRGYGVVLTRSNNNVAISCVGRAKIANKAKADIFIRLHCDGALGSGTHGISMQSPAKSNRWTAKNHKKIVRLSNSILRSTCKATGAASRGVYYRNDLTGNNWAKMPVTLIEMGFMTNPSEDKKLVTSSYQDKLAKGMANGIDKYFGYKSQ